VDLVLVGDKRSSLFFNRRPVTDAG